MDTLDLYLFVTSYTLVVAVAAMLEYFRRREHKFLLTVVVALLVIPANVMVGTYIDPDATIVDTLLFPITEWDASVIAAVLMGVAAALVWCTRFLGRRDAAAAARGSWLEATLLVASICGVVLCGQIFIWKEMLGLTRHVVSVDPEFVIEKIANLDNRPLRLAVSDEGELYINYDYFMKHGAMGGAILRLWPDPESGEYQQRTVVEAPFLVRCYGLGLREGDLYVSRAGFHPQAFLGEVSYASTGAITQLKDLNGDGYFEYAHDVITGLPGIRAPDPQQQNNGFVFAADGSLFVTSAVSADRTLDEHPWGGAILKFSPEFTDPQVYAKGFRNPWTIALGPDDELFATDTDVDKNPGDEINHVIQGEHYGHPFVIPDESDVSAVGFREPIFVGGSETVFLGMVYATSESLPEEYRNCLYVTDFRQNQILRMRLARSGETYKVVEVHPFARVPTPVDLAVTPSGEFFVISRRGSKVYRITCKK